MKVKVNFKERLYFFIMLAISTLIYGIFFLTLMTKAVPGILYFYLAILLIYLLFGPIWFIGHLKGNSIKISEKQFPEAFEILRKQSDTLGLHKIPDMYVLEGSGVLNAFATKFIGRNYIVIYSDILAAAYQSGMPALEFIIGHELGHIKRNHVGFINSILLPAKFIPFLGTAYSRACEYSCDSIGFDLCQEGAREGILILTAGKELYKKVNIDELLITSQNDAGFVMNFAEYFSSHPSLVKRMSNLDKLSRNNAMCKNYAQHIG